MTPRKTPARIAAFIAAVAVTALTFGSQFGLAWHYGNAKADALMAAKRAAPVAQINGDCASPTTLRTAFDGMCSIEAVGLFPLDPPIQGLFMHALAMTMGGFPHDDCV